MSEPYPRRHGRLRPHPPHAQWPGDARIAVQFVINYEEGAENSILHGDAALRVPADRVRLRDAARWASATCRSSRCTSTAAGSASGGCTGSSPSAAVPITVFGVAMALERNPDARCGDASRRAGRSRATAIAGSTTTGMPEDEEREHIRKVVEIHERVVGSRPLGHFLGRRSENTVRLVAEEGGFVYSQDSYADELPYWVVESGRPLLLIPYTADVNDHRFTTSPGFDWGEPFFQYLRDTFDVLYAEGARAPRAMAVGLHCRLVGKAGSIRRARALRRPRAEPRRRLALPGHRHRRALAGALPAARVTRPEPDRDARDSSGANPLSGVRRDDRGRGARARPR